MTVKVTVNMSMDRKTNLIRGIQLINWRHTEELRLGDHNKDKQNILLA